MRRETRVAVEHPHPVAGATASERAGRSKEEVGAEVPPRPPKVLLGLEENYWALVMDNYVHRVQSVAEISFNNWANANFGFSRRWITGSDIYDRRNGKYFLTESGGSTCGALHHGANGGSEMMAAVTTGADDFLSADKGDQWGGGESRRGGASLRPHSTPATLLWLDANYEMADGVCIPRNTLYTHYVHFCGENGLQPVNAASFGKIIRQQFPMLTTRRLGTRGQSRYHYYGIAIRETSAYFEEAYSRKGASVSDGRRDAIRQNGFSQTRYKLTTLLPVFPNLKDIRLPDGVPGDRVSSFFMMYRTHCERIFDTVMRASMEEVHNFLLHFWQGMPPHLIGILSTNVVVNMVGVCDSILYRTICNVLMQSVLQAVPDTLLKVIRKFAIELEVWLHMALEDLPSPLKDVKLSLAHIFSKMLKRQSSLNHLYQAAQMVILDPDLTNQMILDLRRVDLQSICRQSMYTMDRVGGFIITELITDLFHEFVQLLEGKATIETYTEWLESIIERCILNPANSAMGSSTPSLRQCARQFLLMWTAFGTKVIRDMTLHSAPSFGSFHLLHLMFDDYILHLIDVLHLEDRAKEMLRNANHNILTNIETQWESTDTEDTQLANSFTPYPTILLPDYVQLQNLSDDAQGTRFFKRK
ncbi:transcription factor RFX4-like [Hetaerina americana]|uniref:transcription factor RFX4-like n=1 Tax=Hetaerina americana TaxID=62018 RepID=UPI003A7F18F7